MYKFGFIGTGNMGGSLVKAICKNCDPSTVIIANKEEEKAEQLSRKYGCVHGQNDDVAKNAEYIFLGVKPQVMPEMLDSIKNILSSRKDRVVLITMAAGITMERICQMVEKKYPVIRIMPNTPVAIGMGTVVYCVNDMVKEIEKQQFVSAMEKAGIIKEIDEKLIDAASAVSGCGPAFVYMFAEAMADGAVKCGLPRDLATSLAANTIMGAGAMINSQGKSPAQLKDEVCSPGGTTIEGVHALEKGGMRSAVIDAVESAYLKNKKL